MDALGLGGYDSSSEEEPEETEEKIVPPVGKPSATFTVQKRNPPPPPKQVPPLPPSQSIRVNALDGYASSGDEEPEDSGPPSQQTLNLKPPSPPGPPPPPPLPLKQTTRNPSPKASPVITPKPKRKIKFPPSPRSKPEAGLQKNVKRWMSSIRKGEMANFSETIQKTKGFFKSLSANAHMSRIRDR